MVAIVGVCGYAEQSTEKKETPEKVTYDDHVKPILRTHCLSCHNQGDPSGGLALDSYTALREGGGSGPVVPEDGDVLSSRLWKLITHQEAPEMPPGDKVPDEELSVIRAWISGGILENSGSKSKVKKKRNALAMVASSGQKPDGPAAMPESVPQSVPVVTDRPAATTAIAASPWAPLVAIAGQQQIVLYHTETSELLGVLPFEEGIAQTLRFSRDGQFLIAGGGEHAVRGVVAVFDVKTGERVAAVGDELDTVFGAGVNDRMNRVALGGPQKMLRIFDATNGEILFDIKKHTDWIYSVAYSPDGILVASADRSGGLYIWEAETGRLFLDAAGHKGPIRSLAWRDDSNVLASGSKDGTVKLWDMIQGKVVRSINAHNGGVTSVDFDHDGRLVTAGRDRRVRLWDTNGGKIRDFERMPEAVLEVAFSHDGQRVIYGDWNGTVLSVDTEKPDQKETLAANPPPIPKRIESIKTSLASIQTDLAPLKETLDQETGAVEAARKPLDEMKARIAGLRAEADQAAAAAEASREKAAAITAELTKLTAASRDSHDRVIAKRIELEDQPDQAEALAAAEVELADRLKTLAEKRRQVLAERKAAAESDQLAATKRSEADALEPKLKPLEQAVAEAEQRRDEAQAAHDRVASRLTAAQKKMEALAAEIQ